MIRALPLPCVRGSPSSPPCAHGVNGERAMGASAAVAQFTPQQIARGLAQAVPAELSKSPLLGILGVIMGAGIVTLTGRMISLGLADLKGHVGISFDDGAWISTAYNMALVFIGPFTVYRSEEHTSELQSPCNLVCRLLLEKKKKKQRSLKTLKEKTTKKNINQQ